MAQGTNYSAACGILPDQGLNLSPMHWPAIPVDWTTRENGTLCFLKDLLEQSASFLFLCGLQLLTAASGTSRSFRHLCSSAWLCPLVWVMSAFLDLGATCDVVLTLAMSGGTVSESSEHTFMFLCAGLNTYLLI